MATSPQPIDTTPTATFLPIASRVESVQSAPVADVAPVTAPTTVQQPQTQGDVQSYLDNVQSQFATTERAVDNQGIYTTQPFAGVTPEQISEQITPDQPAPETPNLVDLYKDLYQERGIDDLSNQLTDLESYRQNLYSNYRERLGIERGKRVALNVIQGRSSEVAQQMQEEIDFVGRQIQVVNAQITTANNYIQNLVSLTNQDYQNAKAAYDSKFNQNMAIYQQFKSEEQWNKQFDQQLKEYEQNMARSNLQLYMDLITNGNATWDSFDAGTREQIHKMETLSGLGRGFVKGLKMTPGANIKSITTREVNGKKYADIIYVQPDGSIKTKQEYLGEVPVPVYSGGGSSSSSSDKRSYTTTQYNKAYSIMKSVDSNGDRLMSQGEINAALDQISGLVGSTTIAQELFYQLWDLMNFKLWTPNTDSGTKKAAVGGLKQFLGY